MQAAVKDASLVVLPPQLADRLRTLTSTRTPTVGAVAERFLMDVFGDATSKEDADLRRIRAVEAASEQRASMEALKQAALKLIAQAPMPFEAQANLIKRVTENDFSWLGDNATTSMQRPTTVRRRGRPAKKIVDKSGPMPVEIEEDDTDYHFKNVQVTPTGPSQEFIEEFYHHARRADAKRNERYQGARWTWSHYTCPLPELIRVQMTSEEIERAQLEWVFPSRFQNTDCLPLFRENPALYELPWPVEFVGPFYDQEDIREVADRKGPREAFHHVVLMGPTTVESWKTSFFWPFGKDKYPHNIRGFRGYY